nr:MAG TPA: hypothetical protein [Caudoviricetes sp.]
MTGENVKRRGLTTLAVLRLQVPFWKNFFGKNLTFTTKSAIMRM